MTILDEPPVTPAGWTCPHCGLGIHKDHADGHLNECKAKDPAALEADDPNLRPLEEIQARVAEYEALHPSLFRYH